MKIIGTFAVVEDSLYSVQYESEDLHEFTKCFELWNNPVYLREFFEKNIEDLNHSFWNGITIEDAIKKTREDAIALENELIYIAETGKTERHETLSTLFEPLSKGKIGEYERDKARGFIRPSWLRIYAIRIDANFYVISGGAIKLTKTMNTSEHLLLELEKLESTRNKLIDEDSDNLIYSELN
jgi:hypothetical protein